MVDEQEPIEAEAIEVEAVEADQDDSPQAEWSADEEQEAIALGWKPPTEWKGEKPSGYIDDPRRYLERAESFSPFRKLREKSEAELAKIRSETDERLRRIEAVNTKALERQRQQHAAELDQLEQYKRAAVQSGNVQQYDAIDQRQRQLMAQPPVEAAQPEAQPAPEPPDPVAVEYVEKNEWVKNPILRKAAVDLIDANPAILASDTATQIKYAESEMRRMYPAYFTDAPQPAQAGQKVHGGGLAGGKSSAFDKLPAEAKAAYARFAKDGLYANDAKGKEEYANDYSG